MWINEMLTIWLYGSLFALALIVFSLVRWYGPEAPDPVTKRGDEERRGEDRDRG